MGRGHTATAQAAVAAADSRRALKFATILIVFSIVAQRFGFWAGPFPISLTMLVVFPALAVMYFFRGVKFDAVALMLFVALSSLQIVSFMTTEDLYVKPTAMFMTILLNLLYCLCAPLTDADGDKFRSWSIKMFTVFAVFSLIQFAIQFVNPGPHWFKLSTIFPNEILIDQRFAAVNPLEYGGNVYRSNGVFFPEPSYAGAFFSRAVAFTYWFHGSWLALGLQVVALAITFSGLGFATVLCFVGAALALAPRAFFKRVRPLYLILAGVIALLLAISWTFLGIGDYGARRGGEFGSDHSSAYFRFVAPVNMLNRSLETATPREILIGRGPGAGDRLESGAGIELVPNPIVLSIYEYGVFGAILYVALILRAFGRTYRSAPLYLMIIVQVLFIQPMTNVANETIMTYLLGAFVVAGTARKKAAPARR